MTTRGGTARRLTALRGGVAAAFYGTAAVVLVVCWVASLAGGRTVDWGGLHVRLTSWKILRWIAVWVFAGHLIDPRRAATLRAVRDAVSAHPRAVAALALGLVTLHLVLYKVSQYFTFGIGAPDFPMIHYALHNTLHGRFMHAFWIDRSYWSEHFSPILLLLVPAYAVFPSPITLLVAQGLVAAAAIVPLYYIARHFGLSQLASSLVCLVYLNNEFFWTAFVYDVHVEMAAPLFVFLAALAALKARWRWYYAALVLTLAIKEEMAIVALSLGVFVAIASRGARRHAALTVGIAVAWGLFAWIVAIPRSYPEARATSHFISRWSHLGNDYREILTSLAGDPGYVIGLFRGKPVRDLLLSMGFIPLLDPFVAVLAAPALLLHLSADYKYEASLGVYYALPAATLLLLAFTRAIAHVSRRAGPVPATCVVLVVFLVYPGVKWCKPVTAHDRRVAELVDSLPSEVLVAAQTNFVPHLAPSPRVKMFPQHEGAEWILLDLDKGTWPLEPDAYAREVSALLSRGDYGVETFEEGILFLRRGAAAGRNGEALAAVGAADVRSTRP